MCSHPIPAVESLGLVGSLAAPISSRCFPNATRVSLREKEPQSDDVIKHRHGWQLEPNQQPCPSGAWKQRDVASS
jgi:hypothetical protein